MPAVGDPGREVAGHGIFVKRVAKRRREVVHDLQQAVAREAAATTGLGAPVPMVEVALEHAAARALDGGEEARRDLVVALKGEDVVDAAKDFGIGRVVEVDAVAHELLEMFEIAKARHVIVAQGAKQELSVSKRRTHHADDVPQLGVAKAQSTRGAAAHRDASDGAPGEATAVGVGGDGGVVAGQQALGGTEFDGGGHDGRRRVGAPRHRYEGRHDQQATEHNAHEDSWGPRSDRDRVGEG